MTIRRKRRRLLSPMLSDEPLVGESLRRRVRVVLTALAVAFVLTNITSYILGQTFSADARANANRDAGRRVAELERKFNADLAERKVARDREAAAQNARVEQLRRDICVVLDRVQPRDRQVLDARKRYGCTVTPSQAPAAGTPGVTAPSGGDLRGGDGTAGDSGTGPAGPARPQGTPGPRPSNPPPSSPPPPSPEPDDGLVCLPLIGCIL